MAEPIKILFVGDLSKSARSLQRSRALKEMGCSITELSHTPLSFQPGISKNHGLWFRLRWRLGWPIDEMRVNQRVIEEINKERFDVVWIEKALALWPSTLKLIREKKPAPKLVWCSEDDMFVRHNQSVFFKKSLPLYDIFFTTKVYNLTEMKELGARRTELFLDSYDEKTHRPMVLTDEEKKRFACDVGFIGSFEKERAEYMLFLAEHSIPVTIWGNGWGKWFGRHPNLIIKNLSLHGEDYPKAINATKINLNFLRKINRDEVTSRSVEIPACGGFMLAERSKRHLNFFDEGKETEFFGTKEEMLKKAEFYLKDDEKRKDIALMGRERCLKSGYSQREQLTKMLEAVLSS